MSKKLPSPYAHLDEDALTRIQANVSQQDRLLIKAVYPDNGIISYLLETFTAALGSDLKKHGINFYSPDNAAKLVSFIRIRTSSQLTDPRPVEVIPDRNAGVCATAPDTTGVSTDVHEGSKGRVRGRGSKGQQGKVRKEKGGQRGEGV